MLANRLQVIGDQFLGQDDMTTRQWFLSVSIAQFGSKAPTLSEVAQLMGSSHQNTKQLALKLEAKGFLRIEKDREDGRALRLVLTEKSQTYWRNRKEMDNDFIRNLFSLFDDKETDNLYDYVNKLTSKVIKLSEAYKTDETI